MMPRRVTIAAWCGLLWLSGCNAPFLLRPTSDTDELDHLADQQPPEEGGIELVRDATVAVGKNWLKIEGVALVNGLDGTGSDPPASPLRSALISEMQSYEVSKPQQLLESMENSLVVVRGYLPPGVQKGDKFDVEVVVPPKSKTTSLRGGFLMRCRLREMRVLDNAVRTGNVTGLAQGAVLVDSIFGGTDDEVLETRGRVMGGGQSQITRPLGLALRGDASVRQSALIGTAINARFHRSGVAGQSGTATPKRDNFIELAVHPRYKHDVAHYLEVIGSIALRESPGERVLRIESLGQKLLEPTTSARAALELEAIGDDAVQVLLKGLTAPSPEVRFYAARALAYLDREEAAPVLARSAADVSAFRWHALAALTAMDHVAAYEALNELLHATSVETRYGAFRALRTRNAADSLVRGESLGGGFGYHVIASDSPPLVHFAKIERPEVVLFGQSQPLVPPAFLFAGKEIMIKASDDGRLRLTRFAAGDHPDQQETCDANVDQLIRAIVRLGGGYAEVVQAIQEARRGGYLASKVVVNAIARSDRPYHRSDPEAAEEPADASSIQVTGPVPELFADRLEKADEAGGEKAKYSPDEIDPLPDPDSAPEASTFLGRMTHWFAR